jgi:uncharacterized protein (DUF1697 family)
VLIDLRKSSLILPWNREAESDESIENQAMKPTVYLVLFRGVGGQTQLPVRELREKLSDAGFENVVTYINSGNAIVRSRQSRKQVIDSIAKIGREHFEFEKAIFVLTLAEWNAVVARNPFIKFAATAPTTVHAALLERAPRREDVERIRACATNGEGIEVIHGVAYLHTPHGFGRSKMAAKFDAWIGVTNTARNWNTVLKLAELGRAAEAERAK